ncbi:MT-A70 family methyltransferase [Roseibium sp.]|uniref:MT-A70 family methyltransferase n=1 Tax=Roseibium sp. TaxID=1936156 RepID=UPI001B256CCD|nr:DNA methyltransferase [Roseibium sp.]
MTGLPGISGKFGCICADPPWSYVTYSDKGKDRSAEAHYQCMTLDDIAAMPVAEHTDRDCHLFMWITGPCLVQGDHLQIIKSWGFRPSSMGFVWLKPKKAAFVQGRFFDPVDASDFVKGMGHTTRQNAEFVVLGRKGSPKRLTKSMHQLIVDPRREHSRKPEIFRDRVREYVGPDVDVLELFARSKPDDPRWTVFGNETSKFEAVA